MSKYLRHIFGAVTGLIVLVIYIITLHPSVGFIDCGELAAACYTFGVPHPTGYPLFLIIGYLFSHLPLPGPVIYRLNLLSAIEGAAAVAVTYYAVVYMLQNLIPSLLKQKKIHPEKKESQRAFTANNVNIYLIALFTSVSAGLVKSIWFESTQVEVYSLHMLFISVIFFISLKILFSIDKPVKIYWTLYFLFFGLSAANHSTIVYFIPGLVYLYYLQHKLNKSFARSVLPYILLILPGALLYLILIIIASYGPYINWSNPYNVSRLIFHMRGTEFNQLMFSSGSTFFKNAEIFFKGIPGEMAYLPGIVGLTGFWVLWKINKSFFIYVILLTLTCLIISFNYSTAEIQSFYFLIYYILAVFISIGIVFLLLNFGDKKFLFSNKINPAIMFSGIVLFAFSAGLNFKENNSSSDYVNEDITKNTLTVLEQNSILLTYDYSFVFSSSLYFQQVEKLRPDVKVFDIKFLSATWYLEMIKKYYPDVYQNFSTDAEEYINTYNFEEKNHPVRLTKMVKAFFDKNIYKFPIYLTVDCLLSKDMNTFLSSYYPEPDGLVYRLREKNTAYNPDAGKPSLKAFFRKYEPIGYHKNKMYVSTPGVYYETAFYHYKNKNYEMSLKFLDKAFELNSNFKDAVNLKNQIINETKRN